MKRYSASKILTTFLLCYFQSFLVKASSPLPTKEQVSNASKNSPPEYPSQLDKSVCKHSGIPIPNCTNVTSHEGEFYVDDRNLLHLSAWTVTNYEWLSPSTVRFCYPLKERMKKCKLKCHRPGDYSIRNFTFTETGTNLTAGLGDFFLDVNHTGEAFTCRDSNPCCHYIKVPPGDYDIQGNVDFHVVSTNTTVQHALFTIEENDEATLCIPLELYELKCAKPHLKPAYFTVLPYETVTDATYDMRKYLEHCYAGNIYIDTENDSQDLIAMCTTNTMLFTMSLICLVLTLIVQTITFKDNVFFKSEMCFLICSILTNVDISLKRIKSANDIDDSTCYFFFFFAYYFTLSSFLWLTLLSFDVWQTFVNMKTSPFYRCNSCLCKPNNFIYFALVAFTMPFVLLVLLMAVEFSPILQVELGLDPRISAMCWIADVPSLWIFYYVPLIIVTILNVIFYAMSAFAVVSVGKETAMVNDNWNSQIWSVLFKLSVHMGFSWIMFYVGELVIGNANYTWRRILTDSMQSVHGLLFFITYTFNEHSYRQIKHMITKRNK